MTFWQDKDFSKIEEHTNQVEEALHKQINKNKPFINSS